MTFVSKKMTFVKKTPLHASRDLLTMRVFVQKNKKKLTYNCSDQNGPALKKLVRKEKRKFDTIEELDQFIRSKHNYLLSKQRTCVKL